MDSTKGDSIQKGYAFDLIVSGKDEDNNLIYDTFIENLRVIDVVDASWDTTKDRSSEQKQTPKYLVTAVDEELFTLLSVIKDVDRYNFKLIPDDTRKPYVENTEPKIVNERIKDIIEANTSY